MVKLVLRAVEIRKVFNVTRYVCVLLPLNTDISAYRYVCVFCSGSEMFLYVQLPVFVTLCFRLFSLFISSDNK